MPPPAPGVLLRPCRCVQVNSLSKQARSPLDGVAAVTRSSSGCRAHFFFSSRHASCPRRLTHRPGRFPYSQDAPSAAAATAAAAAALKPARMWTRLCQSICSHLRPGGQRPRVAQVCMQLRAPQLQTIEFMCAYTNRKRVLISPGNERAERSPRLCGAQSAGGGRPGARGSTLAPAAPGPRASRTTAPAFPPAH